MVSPPSVKALVRAAGREWGDWAEPGMFATTFRAAGIRGALFRLGDGNPSSPRLTPRAWYRQVSVFPWGPSGGHPTAFVVDDAVQCFAVVRHGGGWAWVDPHTVPATVEPFQPKRHMPLRRRSWLILRLVNLRGKTATPSMDTRDTREATPAPRRAPRELVPTAVLRTLLPSELRVQFATGTGSHLGVLAQVVGSIVVRNAAIAARTAGVHKLTVEALGAGVAVAHSRPQDLLASGRAEADAGKAAAKARGPHIHYNAVRKFIVGSAGAGTRLGRGADAFLAGVLYGVAGHLVRLAAAAAVKRKAKRVTPHDVYLGILADKHMVALLSPVLGLRQFAGGPMDLGALRSAADACAGV